MTKFRKNKREMMPIKEFLDKIAKIAKENDILFSGAFFDLKDVKNNKELMTIISHMNLEIMNDIKDSKIEKQILINVIESIKKSTINSVIFLKKQLLRIINIDEDDDNDEKDTEENENNNDKQKCNCPRCIIERELGKIFNN